MSSSQAQRQSSKSSAGVKDQKDDGLMKSVIKRGVANTASMRTSGKNSAAIRSQKGSRPQSSGGAQNNSFHSEVKPVIVEKRGAKNEQLMRKTNPMSHHITLEAKGGTRNTNTIAQTTTKKTGSRQAATEDKSAKSSNITSKNATAKKSKMPTVEPLDVDDEDNNALPRFEHSTSSLQ